MHVQKLNKIDIADEMLDAAIEEYLRYQRFLAALNLAGVAAEIYAKAVRIEGGADSQLELIEAVRRYTMQAGRETASVKDWKKIANRARNSIKHFDSESDQTVELDPEEEARYMILEAFTNHAKLNRAHTPLIGQFEDHCRNLDEVALSATEQ